MQIVFKEVCKSFLNRKILDKISCEFDSKKVTVFLGPSGSGKTTITKMINGLIMPDSGSVFVDGVLVCEKNLQKIRSMIGFVFQSFNLFNNMNVIENITYAPIHVLKKDKNLTIQKAGDFLSKMGLSGYEESGIRSLSVGQQQRVAIIRALMVDVRILIMDEPTSALDPEMVDNFRNIVSFLRENEIGLIVVTHDVRLSQLIADNVIFLANGKICDHMSSLCFFDKKTDKSSSAVNFLQSFF